MFIINKKESRLIKNIVTIEIVSKRYKKVGPYIQLIFHETKTSFLVAKAIIKPDATKLKNKGTAAAH